MFGRQYLPTKQLVTAAALVVGVSGVTLAVHSSMNLFTQNRGNLNVTAQNHPSQGIEAAGTRRKKDEQKIESRTLPASRGTPMTSPTNHAAADYSALLGRLFLFLAVRSAGP